MRAEITLGLVKGYGSGHQYHKKEVVSFLMELIQKKETFPWRVVESILVYPVNGKSIAETALILSTDKNLRYDEGMSVESWRKVVEKTAEYLKKEFNQERVYVSFLEVEIKIL